MKKRLVRSEFVDDVGVRVGLVEKLVALSNYGETLTLTKEHHAQQYWDKAIEIGLTKDEAMKLLYRPNSIFYPTQRNDEHSRRKT